MRKRRKNKKKTFEKRMMDVGLVPNIAAGMVVMLFVSFLVGLPKDKIIPVIVNNNAIISIKPLTINVGNLGTNPVLK